MTYQIDPKHSSVQFKVRHLMIANIKGEFDSFSGSAEFDPTKLDAARLEISIDVNSIHTREPHRDGSLTGPDFFDAGNYPAIAFRSKSIAAGAGGSYKVAGDLTIKGATREVTLNVDSVSQEITDHMGVLRRGASASTSISRKDFGLTFKMEPATGGVIVSDNVDITLDVELTRAA